jgi:hypothetical protein
MFVPVSMRITDAAPVSLIDRATEAEISSGVLITSLIRIVNDSSVYAL